MSHNKSTPRVLVLSVTPPKADDKQTLRIYVQGKALTYQLGQFSEGKEAAIIESLKSFLPGSVVTLIDSKGSSVAWTAETLALTEALDRQRCDIQFTQRCLLSGNPFQNGIVSWWLRITPPISNGQTASVQSYAKAADSFGDPNDAHYLSHPTELIDIGSENFCLQMLQLRNDYDTPGDHPNNQTFSLFGASITSDVQTDLRWQESEKRYQLLYRASTHSLSGSVGNGIILKGDKVDILQPSVYDYFIPELRNLYVWLTGVRTSTILDSWNESVAQRYLGSLGGDQLFSALPQLSYSGSEVAWEIGLYVTDDRRLLQDKRFTWCSLDFEGPDTLSGMASTPQEDSISARVRQVCISSTDGNGVGSLSDVTATMPMLLSQDGEAAKFQGLKLTTKGCVLSGNKESAAASSFGWQLSLSGNRSSESGYQTVRSGAFEMDLPESFASGEDFRLEIRADYGVTAVSPSRFPIAPQIEMRANPFPLLDVRPASEDDLSIDQYTPTNVGILSGGTSKEKEIQANLQRETAVVFRRPTKDVGKVKQGKRSWYLQYSETFVHEKRQTVYMTLGYTVPLGSVPGQDQSVVVLDRMPFTLAEVHFQPLTNTGERGYAVAEWNSKSGRWTIKQTADKPSYLLMPPQITAEEAVTNDKSYPQGLNDGKEPRLLLGTPTAITYAPDSLRNFVEVPWNLRRLLTDRRLRVSRLDYEMLYAMACHTTAPQMRLTEAATLFGDIRPGLPQTPSSWQALPPPQSDADFYLESRLYWSRIFREYQSRLGIFVTEDPTNIKDPSHFQDTQNTACELRFDDRDTVSSGSIIDPYLTRSEISEDYATPDFKGGALAGVDNSEIFKGIVSSSSSEARHAGVIDPRFSALGGFGTTQARFDNDRSTLINTISLGRTTTYSVERIGRIGCFWNRAKHVIVYERTIVPSRQFYLSQQNSKFAGRPLLRKVEEYCEFVQDERSFAKESQPALAGCVTGFKCGEKKRFAVDSQWGSTVPGHGWKVPLWDPSAGAALRDVYPKPQLFFEVTTPEKTAASSGGQPSYVTRDCLLPRPQEVVFYTSTAASDDADTDSWAAVESVDRVCYPLMRPDTEIYDDGNLSHTTAPEFAVPPGWEPITFTMEAPPTGVHVAAEIINTASPIAAKIKTVTVSRGWAGKQITAKELLGAGYSTYDVGAKAIAGMRSGFLELRSVIATQPNSPPVQAVADVKTKLQALQANGAQLQTVVTTLLSSASSKVTASFTNAANDPQKQASDKLALVQRNIQHLQDAATQATGQSDQWIREAQRLTDMIHATVAEASNWTPGDFKNEFKDAVQSWSAELEQSIGSVSPLNRLAIAFHRLQGTVASLQEAVSAISLQAAPEQIANECNSIAQTYNDAVSGISGQLAVLQTWLPTFDASAFLLGLNTNSIQGQIQAIIQAARQSVVSNGTMSAATGLKVLKDDFDALAAGVDSVANSLSWTTFDLLWHASAIQDIYNQ
jgi:hypothetical protein